MSAADSSAVWPSCQLYHNFYLVFCFIFLVVLLLMGEKKEYAGHGPCRWFLTVRDYVIINFDISFYFMYYAFLLAYCAHTLPDCATSFITRLMFWLQCH